MLHTRVIKETSSLASVSSKTLSSFFLKRFHRRYYSSNGSNDQMVTTSSHKNGQIHVITLNNPSKLNALTESMGDALINTVEGMMDNKDMRAVILTGAGKAFSAGGDLEFLLARHRDTPENNIRIMQDFYKRFLVIRSLPVPVIGAINGAAIGAGLCLALGGCDIRIASTRAQMGLTFVKLGLHPGMAATHFLPMIVGPQVASELMLTGKVIDAAEAKSKNIVAAIGDNALELAMGIAEDISRAAPIAVATTVQTLRRQQNVGLSEAYLQEATAQSICYPTVDLEKGVKALQEKIKPVFTGK